MIKARVRFPGRTLGAMLIGLTLVIAAPALGGATPKGGGGSKGSLTIGSTNVAGDQVLGQVYGQALEKDGYSISYRENLGTREVVFPALETGDIDVFPDYQDTLAAFLEGTGGSDLNQVKSEIDGLLASRGIVATTPAPAVDVNGFYVTKKTAKK